MKTIYKYPIEATDSQDVEMPKGAKIIKTDTQDGKICLWAVIDPNETKVEQVTIKVAGTGHPIEEDKLDYIGTVQQWGGKLVWHIFEVLK